MAGWFNVRIHYRIYVYFAVGLLGMLHTMTSMDYRPDLVFHLIGSISVASVCICRVIYEAGIETGEQQQAYEELMALREEKVRRHRASSGLASSGEIEVRSTYPVSSRSVR